MERPREARKRRRISRARAALESIMVYCEPESALKEERVRGVHRKRRG